MNFKEKVLDKLHNISFTNIEYPVQGNRAILASNALLNMVHISDIESIIDLARIIELNMDYDKEISETFLNIVLEKIVEIVKNKPLF